MMYNWVGAEIVPSFIAYSIAFIALLIGSITDLKTREVPDWVNYGLILSGLGINTLFTVLYNQFIVKEIVINNITTFQYTISPDSYLINSLIGLAILFGVAYIMFYAGQWGGGDSKILMGLGAMIGIDVSFKTPQILVAFFINALFIGAIYGLLWSFLLVFKNRKRFWKEFEGVLAQEEAVKAKKIVLIVLVLVFIIFLVVKIYYIKILVLSLMLLLLFTFYLWVFVKAIEKSAMYKLVEPSKLTEGDWIVKDVFVGREYVTGPKELGISKSQIRKLVQFYKQKKIKKVLIKEGIPFVPSFLIAFIVTFVFGSPIWWLI